MGNCVRASATHVLSDRRTNMCTHRAPVTVGRSLEESEDDRISELQTARIADKYLPPFREAAVGPVRGLWNVIPKFMGDDRAERKGTDVRNRIKRSRLRGEEREEEEGEGGNGSSLGLFDGGRKGWEEGGPRNDALKSESFPS